MLMLCPFCWLELIIMFIIIIIIIIMLYLYHIMFYLSLQIPSFFIFVLVFPIFNMEYGLGKNKKKE